MSRYGTGVTSRIMKRRSASQKRHHSVCCFCYTFWYRNQGITEINRKRGQGENRIKIFGAGITGQRNGQCRDSGSAGDGNLGYSQ